MKIERVCAYCGNIFLAEVGKVNAGHAKFCSCECYHLSTRKVIEKECLFCGKRFSVHPSEIKKGGGKYCSSECSFQHRVANSHVERICENCGKRFSILKSWIRKGGGGFCSRECKDQAQCKEQVTKLCVVCGKEFSVYPYQEDDAGRAKFCSNECKYAWMSKELRGENNPVWNGGSSFEPYGPEWTKELRAEIRDRDGYSCAVCRAFGKVVHHIDYCKTNNVPENLITLCPSCHSRTNSHRQYWEKELHRLVMVRLETWADTNCSGNLARTAIMFPMEMPESSSIAQIRR